MLKSKGYAANFRVLTNGLPLVTVANTLLKTLHRIEFMTSIGCLPSSVFLYLSATRKPKRCRFTLPIPVMNIKEIETTILELCKKLETENTDIVSPFNYLPEFEYQTIDCTPYIQVSVGRTPLYHYINRERGRLIRHDKTTNLDDLLYWTFSDITFPVALKYELNHRDVTKDFRRILFRKQECLLGQLNPEWRRICEYRHREILKEHPYDDFYSVRLDLHMELIKIGMSHDDAKVTSEKKYPRPSNSE